MSSKMNLNSYDTTSNCICKLIDPLELSKTKVNRVSSELIWADRLGAWKARWGINRMNFKVQPGLYQVGDPDDKAPVLVTANYKMSFDRLRQALKGITAWILVLDTHGINVWCAAGKGTFGTAELVKRMAIVGLDQFVSHRTLVLPQLGAPGVSGYKVRQLTGFKVVYGPVRASDIRLFFQAGMKTTPQMRAVSFNLADRLTLVPMELAVLVKPVMLIALLLLLLQLTGAARMRPEQIYPWIGAIGAGSIATPTLLPWIPGRAFAWKGWLMGMFWTGLVIWMQKPGTLACLEWLLILPGIAAYLAMNFTGASTYTSLSGVKKEMRIALPILTVSVVAGVIMWLVSLWLYS